MGLFDKLLKRTPAIVQYQPAVPRTPMDTHPAVNLQQIELLVPEPVMAQNITTEALSHLLHASEDCIRQTLAHSPKAFGLRVRFTIYPDRPVGIDLGANVPTDQTELQATYDALNALDAMQLRSKRQPVALQAYFAINQMVAA